MQTIPCLSSIEDIFICNDFIIWSTKFSVLTQISSTSDWLSSPVNWKDKTASAMVFAIKSLASDVLLGIDMLTA